MEKKKILIVLNCLIRIFLPLKNENVNKINVGQHQCFASVNINQYWYLDIQYITKNMLNRVRVTQNVDVCILKYHL